MAMPATRFRGFRRARALAVIAVTLASFAALLVVALSDHPRTAIAAATGGDGDLAVYQRVVERLHGGENYYAALHDELGAGGYGTRSVLNWRTPLYLSLLARFPSLAWAQAALALLGAAGLFLAWRWFRETGGSLLAAVLVPCLVLSLFAAVTPDAVLFSEVSAGVLILVSVSAYSLRMTAVGFVVATAALFVRELAAPYVVICCVLAWREQRRREVAAWAVALVAYAAYFGWHYEMVRSAIGAGDRGYAEGWLQFGGAAFVLATAAFNGVLAALPLWVAAIVLPVALLGLFAWTGPAALRVQLTVAAYIALFAIVGKPFNVYWGALYTPVLALGIPWGAVAVLDLSRALRPKSG